MSKKQEKVPINKFKEYSLNEVVDLKLIPGVRYCSLYKLVTEGKVSKMNKVKNHTKNLCQQTTYKSIKAEQNNPPWARISGKIYVRGSELIKFLDINNLG